MIYVDQLLPFARSKTWRNDEACRLMADPADGDVAVGLEALRVFAESICLSRAWLRHSSEGMPHFVLSPQRRAYAITQGAHQADRLRAQQIIERWRVLMLPHFASHPAHRHPHKARGSRALLPGSHAIQQPTTT